MKSAELGKGIWFGGLDEPIDEDDSVDGLCLQRVLRDLKKGHFHTIEELKRLISHSREDAVRSAAARLGCYVFSHAETPLLSSQIETGSVDIDGLLLYAPHTLSLTIVPSLLRALELCECVEIKATILGSLDAVLNFGYSGDEFSSRLKNEIVSTYEKLKLSGKYIFRGVESNPGLLTKKLVEESIRSITERTPFRLSDAPTLLSIWTGILCPVQYGSIPDSINFERIVSYVNSVSSIKLKNGHKYFYGHLIK